MNIGKGSFKRQKTSTKVLVVILLLGLAIGSIWGIWYGYQFFTGGTAGAITTPSTSTFKLVSEVDGEDVSWSEISIWIPEDDEEFTATEDIFTLVASFDEEKSSIDAEDISIDLSSYPYVWIEIDPDGEDVWSNDYYLLTAPTNRLYTIYVKDQTTDVNFNLLNSTMDEVTMGAYQTDGNHTFVLDCPHDTTTEAQLHKGSSGTWDTTADDWAEMTTTEKLKFYDEKDWAYQNTYYDPSVDTSNEFDTELEQITNAFALKMTFNTSISTVDGATTEVTITLGDEVSAQVVTSGVNIYIIFYEAIYFDDGVHSVPFEVDFGTLIELDDVDSGRIVLPQGASALGAFTKLSDIGV